MSEDEIVQDMIKKWRAQLSRGMLELLILIFLQKERYGWDILQLIRSILPPSEPMIADGTIYNILNRLKKRGVLTTENKIIDGRMRRYFKTTKMGKEVSKIMLVDWEETLTAISEAQEMNK
ncbi:MAG: PadR family transcriptional regulator [Candidatus Heimdallarchaeaceae archaeon]